MAYEPYDYFGQFMAPLQKNRELDIQQQQVDAQKEQAKAKAAEIARKAAQVQAFQTDAQSVIAHPTPDGYRALLLKYPDMHEGLKASWDQYSDGQKSRNTEAAASVYSALQNGRPDLALSILKERKTALANGGEDTKETDAIIEAIESGDPAKIQQAKGIAGMVLATATGPDKIGSTLESLDKLGAKRTTVVDGILIDQDTGQPIAQSPYSRIIPGPDGSFYEQPRASNIPTFGGSSAGSGSPTTSAPAAGRRGNGGFSLKAIGNPGAIKDGPFAKSQPGYQGSRNGFAVFSSPELGASAQESLLRGKYLAKPKTAAQIVNIYAPPGENSAASRTNYARYIEDRLGLAPGQKLTAEHAPNLAQAMREFETGDRAKTPVRIASAGQYARLPSGAMFYDPKGNLRRKP